MKQLHELLHHFVPNFHYLIHFSFQSFKNSQRDDKVSKLNSSLCFCCWVPVAKKCLKLCLSSRTKFTLIEQLHNTNIDKELATLQLKKLENFWRLKLKKLHLNGSNAELNFSNI